MSFPAHPEGEEHNHRKDTDGDDAPEGYARAGERVAVHAEGQLHVHSEQTSEERRERYRNRHDGQVLHQLVHVVVDDACARIHHGRQDVCVDVCLLQALVQIGATSQKGQYDFYREISVGDTVIFTDVEGNQYTYTVTNLQYEKHADQITLDREESSLTLFIKNVYGFEYLIISCDIMY